MDPEDLQQRPEKVHWYRATDPRKTRAAFLWKRRTPKPPGFVFGQKKFFLWLIFGQKTFGLKNVRKIFVKFVLGA